MAAKDSMLNTPPTFSIYLLGFILHWIEDTGGLAAMGERNAAKAQRLYGAIDASDFYANPVETRSRSRMNVFRVHAGPVDGRGPGDPDGFPAGAGRGRPVPQAPVPAKSGLNSKKIGTKHME